MRRSVDCAFYRVDASEQPPTGVPKLDVLKFDVLKFAVIPVVMGCLGGALLPASQSFAACTPPTGNNTTVTCSGVTINQGPGINTGYGDSTQNGVTINIQSGASVTGTSTGIDLNNNNTINNAGTINTNGVGIGNVYGINGNGPLTVNNSGTIGQIDLVNPGNTDLAGINEQGTGLTVTNTSTGVIQGDVAILAPGTPSIMMVVNSGLISGIVGGGGMGISGDNVTVTNNQSGTITADAYGINANTATIYNYGVISAPAAGSGGTAVNVNALTLVNYASGIITGDGFGVSGSFIPVLNVTNFGAISGTGLGGTGIEGNTVTLVNSGTVSGGLGGAAISTNSGAITNNVGGTITGGIFAFDNTSIFNAGTITSAGSPAIQFTSVGGGGGGNSLTIAPPASSTATLWAAALIPFSWEELAPARSISLSSARGSNIKASPPSTSSAGSGPSPTCSARPTLGMSTAARSPTPAPWRTSTSTTAARCSPAPRPARR